MPLKFSETDIALVSDLNSYDYKKTMHGVVPDQKQHEFNELKERLQSLSDLYKDKYDSTAGVFKSERSTGNPISYHGNLRRVWSGIYKGTNNKQYAAQISFVINIKEKCLDVGFYFGRAGSFNLKKEDKERLLSETKKLGRILYIQISNDNSLKAAYDSLFDLGFKAEIKEQRVTSEEWLQNLLIDPIHSSIVFNLKPNDNGEIESSSVDLYVAMVIPLISGLPEHISEYTNTRNQKRAKALSPEQRAKQAEKRTLIGLAGEEYIMNLERERLKHVDLSSKYPIHQALISDSFRYDILSVDDTGNELFIEVKTTTLLKEEKTSNKFFISSQEYAFYEENKDSYRLYRVYDVYGKPSYEILDLASVKKSVDKYKVEY